jgi:predicted MFS family arabinose efflux permease
MAELEPARPAESTQGVAAGRPDRRVVVTALGVTQILAWGSTFYLLAVLAAPIARDTGWPYDWVIAGVSAGLLVAGIVSPRLGREIGRRGGRSVLALGAVLIAAGLLLLGCAQNFAWYVAAWLVLGCGMGAGLYDAAFSTLGSIYGQDSRSPISAVTLFGGFASTVCWPASAFLVEHAGWRGACFVYAAMHAGFALPIYLFALPARSFVAASVGNKAVAAGARLAPGEGAVFAVLATVVTIGAAILSLVGTHLIQLLQARGVALSAAVALGMLIGPSAVGARVIEALAGHRYHPVWTMIASVTLVAAGALLLLAHLPVVALAIILYASGNGIGSIARGTLPLALFGAAPYPVLMGRLALPILISMAVSPFVGAWLFQLGGADWTLRMLTALALLNVILTGVLWHLSRTARHGG